MRIYKDPCGNYVNEETNSYNGLYSGMFYTCYYTEPDIIGEDETDVRKQVFKIRHTNSLYWL